MKFYYSESRLSFSIASSNGKQAHFRLNNLFQVEGSDDSADYVEVEAVQRMIGAYQSLDYNANGYIILKDLNQPLRQGTLQLIVPGSLLKDLSIFCGKDNVRVMVTLANLNGGTETISTKGMAVMPTCEDSTVKFPSDFAFNMFCNPSGSVSSRMTIEVEVTSAKPSIKPKPNMVYEKMLQYEICSDAVIIAKDGGQIKCHKSVLSASSSVFEAMFQTDMKESKTHQIEMPDMTEESVRALLKYIYCPSTEEPEKNCKIAFELLGAAHKYDIIPHMETAMKELLLSKPVEWYDLDVAVDLFQFSRNLPSGDTLKTRSVEVLKTNYSSLKQQESFREMFHKNPEAAMELYELSVRF